MVSVLILTKNEEQDLPGCLASAGRFDDIHVFDSFSSDRTVEIARGFGAQVHQRVFDGYASHRNAALSQIPFRYPWVISLDADERLTPELAAELPLFVRQVADTVVAGRIRRRDFFMGRWLRHAQISPWFLRLVRPNKVRYRREVNEVLEADGDIQDLQAPLDHFPFSKGLSHWIQKHNVYSTMEAEVIRRSRETREPASWAKALGSSDFNVRRAHQKTLFYRLPCRPLFTLAYMMVLRRAFLDGRAGITYAFLQAIYEYLIVLKTEESDPFLQLSKTHLTPLHPPQSASPRALPSPVPSYENPDR